MSVEELLALHDREQRVRRKASADELVVQAAAYWKTANAWLQENKANRATGHNPARAEAVRIAEDDACFIGVKVQLALELQLRRAEGEFGFLRGNPEELANVALALIERSERAWRTIATAGDEKAPALADHLAELRELLEAEFPGIRNSSAPGSAVLPRLEASGSAIASLEARISALEKRIDGLTRGIRRFQKQPTPTKGPRRRR